MAGNASFPKHQNLTSSTMERMVKNTLKFPLHDVLSRKTRRINHHELLMNIRCLLLISFLTGCLLSIAHAAPTWKKDLTPATLGPHPPLAPSVLDLNVSWKGLVNSGKVTMEFAPKGANKPAAFVVRSTAISLGPAAVVFPYKGTSWTELETATLKPRFFHSVETKDGETVTTTTRYSAKNVESKVTSGPTGKTAGAPKSQSFGFSPVFEVYSAILHIRSQKLTQGDRITLVIHPFNNPYLLRAKVVGREKHDGRDTIRLSVDMQKIDRKTLDLKPYKKIKSAATLWLSDDADRIPIELRADVFIGDIRATLSGFRKL